MAYFWVAAYNSFFIYFQDFSDSSWPLSQPDLPKITNIQVQCEKNSIRVNVDFDRPFFGLVFSKGHFSDPSCIHLQPGSGATSTVFEIQMNQCGMASSGKKCFLKAMLFLWPKVFQKSQKPFLKFKWICGMASSGGFRI